MGKPKLLCTVCDKPRCAWGLCRSCYRKARRRGELLPVRNDQSAFWNRVDKSGGPDSCWPMSGALDRDGYASFANVRAPRYAWILVYGEAPNGSVLHLCDNPTCVNPAHLQDGTQMENIHQMIDRNRSHRGSKHYVTKLSEEQVREIRMYMSDPYIGLAKAVADMYGVSRDTVYFIATRRTWAWLD